MIHRARRISCGEKKPSPVQLPEIRLLRTCFLLIVVLSVALLAACQQETRTDTPAPPAASLVVDSVLSADSAMIQYDVQGSGDRALVFVHCWCCDRTHWVDLAKEFSKDYKIVTLDLAGHGESGTEREAWTMAAYGADVAAVVEKLQLPEVILIGHSMGGTVMIEAARRLGEGVVALVGIDNLQDLERDLTEEQITGYLEYFGDDFPSKAYEFVMTMFPETADSMLAERIAKQMSSAPENIALDSFDDLFHYDYVSALSEVRLPIRCINSDKYPINLEANNRVAESYAVELMPGAGHFPHLVDPVTFNRLLHQTIEEFWPKTADPEG